MIRNKLHSIYLNIFFHTLLFLYCPNLSAQHTPSTERSDPNFRTQNQLESNNIRTTVFNWGQTGRESGSFPITEQTPYEWYKNTGQIYLALTGLCIGAEVADENDDTIHIVDVFNYRTSPLGETWNFEPIPGYLNTNTMKVAASNDPSTWPDFWPDRFNDPIDPGWAGSWDGYFGKNVIINGQEFYFKFTDDLYDKYSYYPDTTDLTRKGLGLIISGRALSFNEDFLKDIVFYSYKIKNDGTKTLNKLGISFWWPDFVGGDGNDDILRYDLSKNLILSFDQDNISPDPAFYDEPVGAIGLSVLKFPAENLSFNNIQYLPSSIWPANNTDEELWDMFFTPGSFVDTNSIIVPGDYNAFANINYFSLQPGETKELLVAVALANGPIIDPTHSIRRNRITGQYFAALAASQGNFNFNAYSLSINTPTNGQSFSDEVNINWTVDGAINRIVDYIYFSTDCGDSWNFLTADSSRNGNYIWNTQNFKDGILYKLKIISVSENGTAIAESDGIFKINKSNVNALPQVYIIDPQQNSELTGEYLINLISGDADGDSLQVDLFYRIGSFAEWQLLTNSVQNDQYNFYTPDFPNSDDLYIKAIVTSNSDSGFYQVKHLKLYNERLIFPDTTISFHSNSPATGIFDVRVINQSQITGNDYLTVFEEVNGYLVYDVFDETNGIKLINDAVEVDGISEGPYFDGLRLFIKDDELKEIDSLTGWNNFGIFPIKFARLLPYPQAKRSDYKIEIAEAGVDTSLSWIIQSTTIPAIPVNFKVFNITENKYIDFAFLERDTIGGNGYFSRNGSTLRDAIYLLEQLQQDTLINTYVLYLDECELCSNPLTDDIYTRYIKKPFYSGDSVFFSTQRITDIDDAKNIPMEYFLDQNYPNPFNPTTKIRFNIPESSYAQLEIFDVLGRKILTLLNQELNAGRYVAEFNGSRFASGVYIYRLKAGNFQSSNKMILIK